MASPVLSIVPRIFPPPDPIAPQPWVEQVSDAHAAALHELTDLESRIWNGEPCLALLRLLAERRVNGLRAQLREMGVCRE